MEVSIVIPAFNEEKGIGFVLDRTTEAMKKAGIKYEIIVVDDGSIDKTGQIARVKKVTVVRHPQNAGYGAAIQTGMQIAKYKNIAITDADGTYPVEEIPLFLKYMEEGFDLVIGARTGKFYRYIWFKQPARYFFKKISEFVTGVKIPDPNSGLRVYRKSVILPLLNSRTCRGFSFSTSTTLIFILEGKFVKFVPIKYFARKGRTKVKFIRDFLRTSQILTETIVFYNPFKLFLLIFLLLAFIALIFLLIYIISHSLFALVFLSLLFLSSVFSFNLGLAMTLFKQRGHTANKIDMV